ncbi:hypothetical protein C2G38_2053471 [Gigaspora rosea]|uniref:Uncharacterized protein n=1 Tax=Gigaspora rosea TaxID=44941 RepID=A0A397WA24_9GLOM|nr:hypothetical protein C2G38_2053471 [Gigaspora rosea]
MIIKIFILLFSFFSIPEVYTWSSTRFIYNICNTTYTNDLFHIDEQSGVFHTDSPYVQDVTYIGKGVRNFPTHMYLINLDGCTNDCNIMFRAEVGQNFSLTSPAKYYCKPSSSYQPFTVNVTSVNIYSGVSPNIKYNVPPSIVLHYCKKGINIDDNSKTFNGTKDAFACLDELTSSPPGTHFGLINIGQDTKKFFNMSIYSQSTISLANAVNNFAQIMNSVSLGAKDGSTSALDKLDDIRNKLVPENLSKSTKKVMHDFWAIMEAVALLIAMGVLDALGVAIFGEGAAAAATAEGVAQGAVLVERTSIAFSRGFMKFLLSALDLARETTKPEEPESKPEEWLNLANQSIINSTKLIEENKQNDSYIELNKAIIYQSRIPTELLTQQPFSQISSDIQNLIDFLQRHYFSSGNTDGSMFPTMRVTAAIVEESDSGELTSGARFNPLAARGPWRTIEKSFPNSSFTAGIKKRDINLPFGAGVDLLQTLSIEDAMKNFQQNIENSSITLDDLKSKINDITSSINTEFKNSIASNLDGRDMLVLDNFLTPQVGTTEDNGRSTMAKFVNDYLTANVISIVMNAYGAIRCSNSDVQEQCIEYWCNCNPPIGNGSCTFAGGFGPNNDGSYEGYRKEHLDLIHQWRDVSDICQNVNGWGFNYDTCEGYKRHVGKSPGKGVGKRSTKYLSCRATDNP